MAGTAFRRFFRARVRLFGKTDSPSRKSRAALQPQIQRAKTLFCRGENKAERSHRRVQDVLQKKGKNCCAKTRCGSLLFGCRQKDVCCFVLCEYCFFKIHSAKVLKFLKSFSRIPRREGLQRILNCNTKQKHKKRLGNARRRF